MSNPKNVSQSVTLTPPLDTLDVPSSLIEVWDGNARTNADPKYLQELAASIKREGQLQPVGLEKMSGKHEGKFLLIFGFSRFAAITGKVDNGLLGRDVIRAKIFDAMEERDRRILNLVENTQRENLSTFDIANAANTLRVKWEMSGASIAGKLGKTPSYINNLIRAACNASPEILTLWRQENTPGYAPKRVITSDWLNKVCKGEPGTPEFTHEEQNAELRRVMGLDPVTPDGDKSEGGGDGDGDGDGGTGIVAPKRAGAKDLKAALIAAQSKAKEAGEAMKKSKDGSKDRAVAEMRQARCKGIAEALAFALGAKDIIPGVWSGKPSPDEE